MSFNPLGPENEFVPDFDDIPVQNNPSVIIGQDDGLTEEEKEKVIQAWNDGKEKIKDIIEFACGKGYDGRSMKGKAVKQLLAGLGIKAKTTKYEAKLGSVVLTPDQMACVKSMAPDCKPLEIARMVFKDQSMGSNCAEFFAIKAFYETLPERMTKTEGVGEYYPPRTEIQAFQRINKYVYNRIDTNKVTQKEREYAKKLISCMNMHRFLFEINALNKLEERELFESTFVKFIYDKPDLTEEETELYLVYSGEVLASHRMKLELIDLIRIRDDKMNMDDKFPQALIESINTLRQRQNDCAKRCEGILKDLNGKRADRLDRIQNNNASVLMLIDGFRDREKRKKILQVIQARKERVKKEGERLESMDSLKFELFGGSMEELT